MVIRIGLRVEINGMKAVERAQNIIEKFGTNDVFEIVLKSQIKIVYGDWHPITIGEFDKKTNTICINHRALAEDKNALELEKKIIAHELGHFFAQEFDLDRKTEEDFALNFAQELFK